MNVCVRLYQFLKEREELTVPTNVFEVVDGKAEAVDNEAPIRLVAKNPARSNLIVARLQALPPICDNNTKFFAVAQQTSNNIDIKKWMIKYSSSSCV